MESLTELQSKLGTLENELESITEYNYYDTPFMPGQLDGKSESYKIKTYKNPDRASQLLYQINLLKSQIDNYGVIMNQVAAAKEIQQDATNRYRKDRITTSAKALYDEKMNAYMAMNFWGKAKALFTGKKPKKMGDQEIVSTYGMEAINPAMEEELKSIEERRNLELQYNAVHASDRPEMLAMLNASTNSMYDEMIKSIKSKYEHTAQNLIGGSR